MADWKNQLGQIQNKIKQQLHAKKIDDLESINRWIQQFDTDGSGVLEKYEFERFLGKIGIFLTSQEFRCVYDHYDLNKDGRIQYDEFIQGIRTHISEKRLSVVKHVFQFLDTKKAGVVCLQELFSKFQAQQHPRVLSKQKTVDQVRLEFESCIVKRSQDQQNITEADFLEYYADVNATMPNEKEEYFVNILLQTWAVQSSSDYVSPERLQSLETILHEKIRQKTPTNIDEGQTIKATFKYFDAMNTGVINIQQFQQSLEKFGCQFSPQEIQSFFLKYDTDRSGSICYDEFCNLFATIGSGNNPNVKPVFSLQREIPKDTMNKIKLTLTQRQTTNEFLGQCFIRADKNQNGTLDREEFKWAMREAGLILTNTEFTNIFRFFDKHNNNSVQYKDFVSLLQ